MDNDNYIDKLFSEKFEKFESQTLEEDWNKLNSKLSKSNFLKFSVATFNVFYLAVFLSFAGTATYFGVNNAIKSNKIKTLENKVEVLQKQVNKNEIPNLNIDSIVTEKKDDKPELNNNKALNIKAKNEVPQNISNDKVNVMTNLPQLSLKKDSVSIKPDSSLVNKPNTQKITRVKKTIVIKKDKVLLKDTVRIKKKVK
jgi:hypothetical protein